MLQIAYQNKLFFRVPARNETKASAALDISCAASSPGRVATPSQSPSARLVALYRQYRAVVYARCRRLLNDVDEAEDATQEVFIRALNHLNAIPAGVDAARWLYRTATNYCFNRIRDRKVRAKQTEKMRSILTETSGHAEETAVHRDVARRVLAAVTPMQRMVVMLHYVEEMDQHEVAYTLRISRRTVVNRLAELNGEMSPRLRALV